MSNLTGRQIMLLAGCALLLITAAAGIYGLLRGPGGTSAEPSGANPTPAEVVADPVDPVVTLEDRALPYTTDPLIYARAVAVSLFDWDAAAGFLPTDYTAAVLSDADPSGEETPGLLNDVATYLPTVEQWLDLGAMQVVQTIEINEAFVPGSWTTAAEQARGRLRPGTVAVTITGTRHRKGVWNGEVAESSNPVSFSVFAACRPSFERCRLLRLSRLDSPLR